MLATNLINAFLSVSLGGAADSSQDSDAMQVPQAAVIAQITSELMALVKLDLISKLERDVLNSSWCDSDTDTESESGAAMFSDEDDDDDRWRIDDAKVQCTMNINEI